MSEIPPTPSPQELTPNAGEGISLSLLEKAKTVTQSLVISY